MVEVRACVYFFVLFLSFHGTVGKPFFGLFCDLICEDDDPATTTTSTSTEDFYDDLWCGWCEPRRPRTTTTPAPVTLALPAVTANPGPPTFNVVIPPLPTATNLTLWRPNASSGWFMNMIPWNMGAPAGAPPGPPGPPPPTAAPLVATTVAAAPAAGATAAAAAAATTAAPAAPAA